MAKTDVPAWFADEEAWKAHLAALEAELTIRRGQKDPRAKEIEEQIKANGGAVPAAGRAKTAAAAKE